MTYCPWVSILLVFKSVFSLPTNKKSFITYIVWHFENTFDYFFLAECSFRVLLFKNLAHCHSGMSPWDTWIATPVHFLQWQVEKSALKRPITKPWTIIYLLFCQARKLCRPVFSLTVSLFDPYQQQICVIVNKQKVNSHLECLQQQHVGGTTVHNCVPKEMWIAAIKIFIGE